MAPLPPEFGSAGVPAGMEKEADEDVGTVP